MFNCRLLLERAYKIFGLLVMLFCFALATWIYNPRLTGLSSLEQFLTVRIRLYMSWRLSNRWKEVFCVIKATFLGSLMIFVAGKLSHIEIITFAFILVFWVSSSALMITIRLILKWSLEWIRQRGRNLKNILIVGTNARAIDFARKLESKQDLGYRIIGFVDTKWQVI